MDISTLCYQERLVNFNTVIMTLNSLANHQDTLASTRGTVVRFRGNDPGWMNQRDHSRTLPYQFDELRSMSCSKPGVGAPHPGDKSLW